MSVYKNKYIQVKSSFLSFAPKKKFLVPPPDKPDNRSKITIKTPEHLQLPEYGFPSFPLSPPHISPGNKGMKQSSW